MTAKERISCRAAQELEDGDVVNLGIGMPTLVSNYLPADVHITLQSENGILGMDAVAAEDKANKAVVNAGGVPVMVKTGAAYFDSATSFIAIRGGHVDKTILGALQVDEAGNLASHIVPGRMVSGMGGAMDLVTGSRKVIVAMAHTAKDGSAKILKQISLPATAMGKVSMIITELAVIEVTREGLVLKEVAQGITPQEVQNKTEATMIIPDAVGVF